MSWGEAAVGMQAPGPVQEDFLGGDGWWGACLPTM